MSRGVYKSVYAPALLGESLRTLIGDSLFAHIGTLQYDQWQKIMPEAQEAFRGSFDCGSWIEGVNSTKKLCLNTIIAYVLGLLRHTSVNCEGKALSVLWPHILNGSYGIKLRCDSKNSWARILTNQSHAPHLQR